MTSSMQPDKHTESLMKLIAQRAYKVALQLVKDWGFFAFVTVFWVAAAIVYMGDMGDSSDESLPQDSSVQTILLKCVFPQAVAANTGHQAGESVGSHSKIEKSDQGNGVKGNANANASPHNPGKAGGDAIESKHSLHFKILATFAIVAAITWFFFSFTGNPHSRRTEAVRFSYFFVLASFGALAIPPLTHSRAIGTEPLSIVSGCVRYSQAEQLRCWPGVDENSPIGKNATQGANADGGRAISWKLPPTDADGKAIPPKNQWLVNIGGTLSPQCDLSKLEREPYPKLGSPENRAYISGGIVVPLPYVVIAMFGGAISLSRRVPEIQRKSEDGYVSTETDKKLHPGEVREQLAFQILQFISAPLIAIVAYQVIEPEKIATAAALAFMSGFGSETILLLIRGISEGAFPRSSERAISTTGAIQGMISKDGKGVERVLIAVENSNIKTESDLNGNYLLSDVPHGWRNVVASSEKDGKKIAAKASVTVLTEQTATCNLILEEVT